MTIMRKAPTYRCLGLILLLLCVSAPIFTMGCAPAKAQSTGGTGSKLSADLQSILALPPLQQPLVVPVIVQGSSAGAIRSLLTTLLGATALVGARDLPLVNGLALDLPLGQLLAVVVDPGVARITLDRRVAQTSLPG